MSNIYFMYILSLGTFLVTLVYLSHIVYFKRTGRTVINDRPDSPNYQRMQKMASRLGVAGFTSLFLLAMIAVVAYVKYILQSESTEDAVMVLLFGALITIGPLIASLYFSYKILNNK